MKSDSSSRQRELTWIGLLLFAALAAGCPLLTSHLVGGTDARWYAYMLADFRQQLHLGRFPGLVGQGEFAWNGGIHPFRSAPLYMLVAGGWDVLTFGKLDLIVLQHLTLLTSLVAGTLGFFAGARRLSPGHDRAAAAFAALYLTSPAWLIVLYGADAYMSCMAFAALPLVLYGNARSIQVHDAASYRALGAGLALIWMCHPPIAAAATLTTVFIQCGGLLADGPISWRPVIAGVLWFGLLSAFYFASMSEIPSTVQPGVMREIFQVAGLGMFFTGLGNAELKRRGAIWWVWAGLGAVVVATTSRPWLEWIGISSILVLVFASAGRRTRWIDTHRQAFPLLYVAAMAAAAITYRLIGSDGAGFSIRHIRALDQNSSDLLRYLRPIGLSLRESDLFQLGWGITLPLVGAVATFLSVRSLAGKVILAATLTGICLFLHIPWLSDFLFGYFPRELGEIANLGFGLRQIPVMTGFAALAGFIWLSETLDGHRGWRAAEGPVLALAVGWAGFQAAGFLRLGFHQTGDSSVLKQMFRSENVVLDRYAYDLLPLPGYFSNGVTDPRLESRVTDAAGHMLSGPNQTALEMERAGAVRLPMKVHLLPNAPRWFELTPLITLQPGEHRLLRFEFNPSDNYDGFLIGTSEHGYREYRLPDSGQGESKAFGVGGQRTQVISLWNSGRMPEHYKFEMQRAPGNRFQTEGEAFADVIVSTWDPSKLSVRLDNLIPYRAAVSTGSPAILETFRCYLPGYRATVDGRPTPVIQSPQKLVSVKVPAGTHTVELRYVGTPRVWFAGALSIATWAAWIYLIWRDRWLAERAPLSSQTAHPRN